ncbi:hypothetical protein KSF_038550 [Reticulibacter mediterranei]|uniref:CHAT domain-containing protein n=1 Tax=Reticulibacter mediterranei TaxID=2778369 RepID=A0A8J3IM72_9CHLR|nr:CHAT domain-containing protein [Reticulibacter mediterranei]GHO93807.1 hypothetical protein KSF_038550 [Reticulibacter mediterranei]
MAKILFLSTNLPTNQGYLRVDKEYRIIEEKLRSAIYRDRLALVSVPASRPKDWLDKLNQHSPNIVHFSGHGSPGRKLFQLGEDDDAQLISLQALKTVCHSVKDTVRLLVLNACYSRQEAEPLTEEVDCVIAMKGKIHDTAALAFTEAFYQALGYGLSVQDTFTQARAAIQLEMLDKDTDVPE